MTIGKVSVRNTVPTYTVPYIIRKGDNLTNISKGTQIPISKLVEENNIKDPNLIVQGDTLNLNIYEYSIIDISTKFKKVSPDCLKNLGASSTYKQYQDINKVGVSVWLEQNSK